MDIGSFGAGERWGESRGVPGRAGVCSGVRVCCYGAWHGVLDVVWAWYRLDLHGDIHGLSWGELEVGDRGK